MGHRRMDQGRGQWRLWGVSQDLHVVQGMTSLESRLGGLRGPERPDKVLVRDLEGRGAQSSYSFHSFQSFQRFRSLQ